MLITASVPAEMFLNFDYAQARQLVVLDARSITLALVGCGGTGSWLAPSVVRVARLLKEQFQRDVSVVFIDPDVVEEKNIYRQNFCQAEVGRNKAETLAYRYGLAWGVDVIGMACTMEDASLKLYASDLNIAIGCVDGARGRRQIEHVIRGAGQRAWWLDCGNFKAGGQVLVGSGAKPGDPFAIPGLCTWLPKPSVQHPELLEEDENPLQPPFERGEPECLSCAEMAMLDSQGLAINQRVAAEASDYLVRMLLTKDLNKFATYIDLASGSSRSRYITEAAIREFISS